MPPSLPARRPCPAPCLLGGWGPAKRGCVCGVFPSLQRGKGGSRERAGEAPVTTRPPLPPEATRAAAAAQEISGGWRALPLRPRLQGQRDLSPWPHTPALPYGLSHPHPDSSLTCNCNPNVLIKHTPLLRPGYPLPLHVSPALPLHLGSPSSRPRLCTCRAICPDGPSSHPPCQTDSSKIIIGVTCTSVLGRCQAAEKTAKGTDLEADEPDL